MSIWAKLLSVCVLLGLLVVALAFWMDLYGIRRGCFASRLDQARYQSAQSLASEANGAIASKNYAAANDMLDLALSRLGDTYQLGRAADETGEAVLAAKSAAARGEFQIAARIKSDVMVRRLGLFQRKTHLSGLCQAVRKRWSLG